MKSYLLILFVVGSLTTFSIADDKLVSPNEVVVKVLKTPLPQQEEKMERFLWNTFANQPDEEKFRSYRTEGWKDNYKVFAESLVEKAKGLKLDSVSLSKALDLVLKHSEDKIAYLPVGAYQTTLDRNPVWIIAVKWEYPSKEKEAWNLSHIRTFVFDQKSLKQVGFNTCM